MLVFVLQETAFEKKDTDSRDEGPGLAWWLHRRSSDLRTQSALRPCLSFQRLSLASQSPVYTPWCAEAESDGKAEMKRKSSFRHLPGSGWCAVRQRNHLFGSMPVNSKILSRKCRAILKISSTSACIAGQMISLPDSTSPWVSMTLHFLNQLRNQTGNFTTKAQYILHGVQGQNPMGFKKWRVRTCLVTTSKTKWPTN